MTFRIRPEHLRIGSMNVLAAQVHQHGSDSSDLIFDLEVVVLPWTPGAEFYDRMFEGFAPAPAVARLQQVSFIELEALPVDWRLRMRCQILAAHQRWEEALAAAAGLEPSSGGAPELARFRWLCLRKLGRYREATELVREMIPARPVDASDSQVDLTEHYLARTDEGFYVDRARRDRQAVFADLPTGLVELAGTEFDVRGAIPLGGPRIRGRPIQFPNSVTGIAVGREASRIHFLHSPDAAEGTRAEQPVARYLIHYDDGVSVEHTVRHHPGWNRWGDRSASAPPGSDFKTAWQGDHPSEMKKTINVYKSTWENPRPDASVASIDIVRAEGKHNLAVFAITVD